MFNKLKYSTLHKHFCECIERQLQHTSLTKDKGALITVKTPFDFFLTTIYKKIMCYK